jgi:hypothetical protein
MKTKFLLFTLFFLAAMQVKANNMLVKNVTTSGDNATNKSIQVQFDMSWDNSWRDGINWDAAWVFMKYKDASGNWQHVQLNTTGFANGTGTANTIQVGSDKVGAFVYRSAAGTGTFTSTSMQLQWNYGLSGLTSVIGLEIRVFAVEMVYVPQGDFNIAKGFYVISSQCCGGNDFNGLFNAPGGNFPVINQRLSPALSYAITNQYNQQGITAETANIRIKGDAGIDTNNDGVVDNTTYPTGYKAFYSYKYEMTEQQYADFLNTLSATQITTLGVAGSSLTLTNGQYFTSTPNKACGNSNANRLFAYADWSGVRPMSLLEYNKATYGPFIPIHQNSWQGGGYTASGNLVGQFNNSNGQPVINNVGYLASSTSSRQETGASYYGIMDLTGVNTSEPVIKLNYFNYTNQNGNGVLGSTGVSDISNWTATNTVIFVDQVRNSYGSGLYGFRYVRSAE